VSANDDTFAECLDIALDLDGSALESWLKDLEGAQPGMAQRIRAALARQGEPGFHAHLAEPPSPEQLAELRGAPMAGNHATDAGLARGGMRSANPEASPSGLTAGQRVGAYELERLLGAGGMAEVWLARRADGAFKRAVALKLPMVSRLRKDLEERFIRERDILARLEHPNIARLYDGGVDAAGLPYLAMEYVPGVTLTAWCDAKRLGIAERLALLLSVLGAVQYAHERRVIHRDLKPSNILVSETGEVRLLDFGVAKLLEDTEGAQLTGIYGRPLTPDYASPEQIKGEALDARSDVYSIGVLLYELLTGKRPYGLGAGVSLGSLGHAMATVDVRRPSTQLQERAGADRGTTQQKLTHELRGDLDVITLKALAKDPGERYESAAAMAQDIERHLQHRPIRARPAPLSYRLEKFARRNRPVVAVSALAAVMVLATAGYELAQRGLLSSSSSPAPNSIAVLPLKNESGDPNQQYFSDGISEDLITTISQLPGLKVIGRTSSFQFRDTKDDSRMIGEKLGVAHLIEGSVRRAGIRCGCARNSSTLPTAAPSGPRDTTGPTGTCLGCRTRSLRPSPAH
jgi:serine/threonine protein kinase